MVSFLEAVKIPQYRHYHSRTAVPEFPHHCLVHNEDPLPQPDRHSPSFPFPLKWPLLASLVSTLTFPFPEYLAPWPFALDPEYI